jgi:hypothetical protein
MARFTVQKGKRYRAKVNLGFVQAVASNAMVADELRKAGFTDVVVTGSGRTRHAEGSWRRKDTAAEIPDEISHIEQIEV